MKAAPFEYVRAAHLQEALALLAEHGVDAKLLAGGQSLVPMMAMRLARPALLVDIDWLAELKGVRSEPDLVVIGAGTRQRTIEDETDLDATLPLVRRALQWVGHIQTRNRGTVGGSLAHADPSAELPLAAVVLGARMRLQGQAEGERRVAADAFFTGPMSTAVTETECLLDIEFPVWQGGRIGTAFEEIAIRHGDFAMASAACQLQLDAHGAVHRASLGVGGVGGTPLAFPQLAAQLEGQRITASMAHEIGQSAARLCDPGSDLHASAEYRRHLAAVLVARVLEQASAQAAQRVSP